MDPLISTTEDKTSGNMEAKESAEMQSQGIVDQPSDHVVTDSEPQATKKVDPGELTEKVRSLLGDMGELIEKARSLLPNLSEKSPSHKSSEGSHKTTPKVSRKNEDHVRFGPFFEALEEKDWKGVENFVIEDDRVLTCKFNIYFEETIFHILSRNLNAPIWLLKKFVKMVDPEKLEELTNEYDQSPIYAAVFVGNIKAAKVFVEKNKELPNKRNKHGLLPIHVAARCGHKEIIHYLRKVTRVDLNDDKGLNLLKDLINSGHYDVVHDLLKDYPTLAREIKDRKCILEMLATKPLAFESGSRPGFWESLIYKCIPVREKHIRRHESLNGDIENPIEGSKKSKNSTNFGSNLPLTNACGVLCQKLYIMLWHAFILQKVPGLKCLHDRKLIHTKTHEIVRMMCHGVTWKHEEASELLWVPLRSATRLGIHEFVNEILKAYYYSYSLRNSDDDKYSILHLAILHRQEKVFNLIRERNILFWSWKTAHKGKKADTILHLAAKYVPSSQVSGAALQMQRELQWFKAVESFVHPSLQDNHNTENKTPREVFTQEHQKLVEEGEKWIKDNASSCSVVAALIVTIAFAAAFTVPGGNNAEGIPTLLHKSPLIIFFISDALALFTSTVSALMFLGILTSRYSEEDFLVSLPRKLIIGLITLFVSIASMMTAFGAVIYLQISDLWSGVYIPISVLCGLTVIVFAGLQFPLLVEIVLSTYRPIVYQ